MQCLTITGVFFFQYCPQMSQRFKKGKIENKIHLSIHRFLNENIQLTI